MFHDILRCLSVSTPTVYVEGFELRESESDALVEALGDEPTWCVWYIPGASLLWVSRSYQDPLLSLSNQTDVFRWVLYIFIAFLT